MTFDFEAYQRESIKAFSCFDDIYSIVYVKINVSLVGIWYNDLIMRSIKWLPTI